MTNEQAPAPGTIVWRDLTVTDADGLRDFYAAVAGWQASGLDMSGYDDYVMSVPSTQDGVAGICHARGVNADLPPQWLIYIAVDDCRGSVERCIELGGEVIVQPRAIDNGLFAVLRDPAGAVFALYQSG